MVACTLTGQRFVETRELTVSANAVELYSVNKRTSAIDTPGLNETLVEIEVVRVHVLSLFASPVPALRPDLRKHQPVRAGWRMAQLSAGRSECSSGEVETRAANARAGCLCSEFA